jgi:hypothetical protein
VTSQSVTAAAQSAVWCGSLGANLWWTTRTSSCIADVPLTFTLYDLQTMKAIGSADLQWSDSITLDTRSGTFTETNNLTMVRQTPNIPELLVTYSGRCSSLCAPLDVNAYSNAALLPGGTVSGVTRYYDGPPTVDFITLSNSITATVPGGEPLSPGSVGGSPEVRCDSEVGSTTGCVYPIATPSLNLSFSQSGAGAVFVAWAEQSLPARYGWSVPLHRFTGVPDWSTADNRDVVCDSTFVKDPNVDLDSCDEYAFASSKESGALNGVTTGTQCAEVEPTIDQVTGQWQVIILNSNTTNNCARAHVALPSNQSVGGVLSAFIQSERVLDGDAYWVGTVA